MAARITTIVIAGPTTTEEQAAAARMVHRHATSREDERGLLDALGLPIPEVPR